MDHLLAAAEQFASPSPILEVWEYGSGNVNDTFLVTLDGAEEKHIILQRLNARVFPQPELIMGNLGTMSDHLARRLRQTPLPPGRRWEAPRVLCARDGRDHWISPDGSFWRALSFIDGAETFDTIKNPAQAREVGYALGLFHNLLSDLPPERLADTLPGFHITPLYLKHYDEVWAGRGFWERGPGAVGRLQSLSQTLSPNPHKGGGQGDGEALRAAPPRGLRARRPRPYGSPARPSGPPPVPSPELDYCLKFIEARRGGASVLEEAKAQGKLALRVIHGDPKVNNVMLDVVTGRAVALVDLDTVKPGLVHYDIGDCLRSGANPQGEETEDWETVRFEPEAGRAILTGYLSQARDFFTQVDYDYLYDAVGLIAFELGLRFFTDFLEGNVYFKVRHREHNLIRALVQFKLTESIESQETALRGIIGDLR